MILEVQENQDGDLVLEFPNEIIEQLGWHEGDNIVWTENEDGSFTLTKSEGEENNG